MDQTGFTPAMNYFGADEGLPMPYFIFGCMFTFGMGLLFAVCCFNRTMSNVVQVKDTSQVDSEHMLDFLLNVGKLKQQKRTGWIHHAVHLPESVGDHMYRMAMMAFVVRDKDISVERCIKMAIVHDLAEALCGDITPPSSSGVSKAEKTRRETLAMNEMCEALSGHLNGPTFDNSLTTKALQDEIYDLWQEYENGSTPTGTKEARLVKDFDKFEMLITAYEYELAQPAVQLDQFYASVHGKLQNKAVQALETELLARRKVLMDRRAKKGK